MIAKACRLLAGSLFLMPVPRCVHDRPWNDCAKCAKANQ